MPYDPDEESLFRAGQLAPAGMYVQVDRAPERRVVLREDGVLPASFDGRVALYQRLGDRRSYRLPVPRPLHERRKTRLTTASA